jgi:hypothetical protein
LLNSSINYFFILNSGKLFFMTRFLLVPAAVTAYTSTYSQKIKQINSADVVERGYHHECRTYYSNGSVRGKKGTYNRVERHGVRHMYDVDGSLSSRANFKMGSRAGKAELFAQSQSNLRFNAGMTYE